MCDQACADVGWTSDPCCGCWNASLDWVQMWRVKTGSNFPLLYDPGQTSIYDTTDLDFASAAGIDARLGYLGPSRRGVECRYFWLSSLQSDNLIAPGATGLWMARTLPITPVLHDLAGATAPYSTDFQTFELLGRHPLGWFELTYGFRYAELDELFRPVATNGAGYAFAADNDLYGFQIGMDGPLWANGGRLSIVGDIKAGIYYNDVRTRSAVFSPVSTLGSATASHGGAAFLGEVGVSAVYDLTPSVSLRLGYLVFFVDGVALSADQVPNTGNLVGANPRVNADDANTLILQGLQLGAEYRF